MSTGRGFLISLVSVVPLLSSSAYCGGRQSLARETSAQDEPSIELNRRRWMEKSDEERRVLRARFEKLKDLSPNDRRKLIERARRLEAFERSLQETAPEELRKEIERLGPERRKERWHEHFVACSRETGSRLRESLPADMRRRLEEASPEERREIFERVRRGRGEHCRRAIRELGRHLDLPPERMNDLEELPPEERAAAMMRLRRQSIVERVESEGLPPGLEGADWEEMKALGDEAFFQRLRALDAGRDHWRRDGRRDRRVDRPEDRDRRERPSRNPERGERFEDRDRRPAGGSR